MRCGKDADLRAKRTAVKKNRHQDARQDVQFDLGNRFDRRQLIDIKYDGRWLVSKEPQPSWSFKSKRLYHRVTLLGVM
jgi:hypothetical protein